MRGVPLCFRSSCQRVPRRIINFGSGALVMELVPVRDRAVLGTATRSWLVLIGAGLFAAFPMVYAIFPAGFLSADYADAVLIFRGAARRCRDFRNSGRICTFGGQVFVQSSRRRVGAQSRCADLRFRARGPQGKPMGPDLVFLSNLQFAFGDRGYVHGHRPNKVAAIKAFWRRPGRPGGGGYGLTVSPPGVKRASEASSGQSNEGSEIGPTIRDIRTASPADERISASEREHDRAAPPGEHSEGKAVEARTSIKDLDCSECLEAVEDVLDRCDVPFLLRAVHATGIEGVCNPTKRRCPGFLGCTDDRKDVGCVFCQRCS